MADDLAALIERESSEIERRFSERLHAASAAKSLDRKTVIDSLHALLAEVVGALRHTQVGSPGQESSGAAREHGEQRYRLGYDVATLVREYGLLQDILFDLIEEQRVSVSIAEFRTLALTTANAVADSSVRYAHMRDEEQQRQAAQHIGFLAHELRDPLGVAKLGISLAREKSGSPSVLDSVERNLSRMGELIDDALVEVRLRGSGHLEHEKIDLAALIEEVVQEGSAPAGAKDLRVSTEIASGLSLVGDSRVLRSAIANLVRNAVKFSRPGGGVVVRGLGSEGRVRIEVEDSCGGLPDGAVEKVFDPYVQVGRDKSGFGLGLAIAKQAAMAHEGDIRVHDLPGEGCVFVLDMPVRAPAEDGACEPRQDVQES